MPVMNVTFSCVAWGGWSLLYTHLCIFSYEQRWSEG